MLVALGPYVAHDLGAELLGLGHQIVEIDDREGHVLDAVAVSHHTLAELAVVRIERALEHEHDVVLSDDVLDHVALARLQAFVKVVLETESGAVPGRCLLFIQNFNTNASYLV